MVTPPSTEKTNLFEDESIIAYFSDGQHITYAKDETIVNGYDEPSGVYLIKEGFVKACSVSKDGHGDLLFIHQQGDFLPLPWALDGAHTTGLFYVAMTEVTVLRAPKNKLRVAMGSNSWLSQEILKQAVGIISSYTKRIQTLEFRTARGRVISELITLADRFGSNKGLGVVIVAPITHQDIADSINMTRETASRALEKLFEEGLISQDDHSFIIKNLENLQTALR
jgi:CRP/FNR family transcriptional regulator